MIFKLLGRQIDIHTGGIEHIPVHHNNEIAQAEALSGKQYVNYWLHNAHITIEGKKISKSLGNTVYLRQIVDRGLSARALRMWALGGHYRTPMNFTWEAVEGANTALNRLTKYFFEDLKKTQGKEYTSSFMKDFAEAMGNDLDTAKALARVYELVKDETLTESHKRDCLLFADSVLGLGFTEAGNAKKMTVIEHTELSPAVQDLLKERKAAREAKDFEKADDLRKRLEALGYIVKDNPDGNMSLTQK
jgi:cysteinyl-tRNA synthetase